MMEKAREILLRIVREPGFEEGTHWRRRAFETDEVIVREGDVAQRMYLIEQGQLRVMGQVALDDQRKIKPGLADLGPGDLFGEMTLFEKHPRTATVTAIEPGRLLEIDCVALSGYLDAHPETGYLLLKALFQVLMERLSKANERLEHLFAWGLKAHGIDKHLR